LFKPLRLIVVAVGLGVLATACVKTEVTTYERVSGTAVDAAYLKPGTDFSRYSRLYAYPMEIYFPDGAQIDDGDIERIRDIFHDAFLTAIGDDFPVVDKPAEDALGVRASLVDMQTSQTPSDLPQSLALLVKSGQLTFLMELTDSKSGEVLARAADQEKAYQDPASAEIMHEGMEQAAERWATIFRGFLDRNLTKQN